jgi:hypothetical protein
LAHSSQNLHKIEIQSMVGVEIRGRKWVPLGRATRDGFLQEIPMNLGRSCRQPGFLKWDFCRGEQRECGFDGGGSGSAVE